MLISHSVFSYFAMTSSEFPTDPYSAAQQKWLYQDHLVLPTLKNLLEDQVKGKSVLDIGCGNGKKNFSSFF